MFFFNNLQFVLIGKFKGRKHYQIRNIIEKYGGKCTVNCSRNTNFVILPNDIKNKKEKFECNNQIQNAYNFKVLIVHLGFIFECITQNRLISHKDFLVDKIEIRKKDEINVLPQWIECCDIGTGRYYYYNLYTGLTQWENPFIFKTL